MESKFYFTHFNCCYDYLSRLRETGEVAGLGMGRKSRKERLSTPVFWPGELHGLYSPWGHRSQTRLNDFHKGNQETFEHAEFVMPFEYSVEISVM